MVDRGVNRRQIVGAIVLLALLVAAAFWGKAAYDRYTTDYVVERRDDGQAVTKVVRATFSGASALKVGALSGVVQSTASDTRAFGMLTSDRVVKAPFAVDYFIDVSPLAETDYRYDPGTRTLIVDAPDVTVGRANVDEAAATVGQTRGLFVTRGAFEKLAQRVSAAAQRSATVEANKPERLAQARDNARRALRDLLAPPLTAAGAGDVRVLVTFPYERPARDRERWDQSRSVEEVMSNRR